MAILPYYFDLLARLMASFRQLWLSKARVSAATIF